MKKIYFLLILSLQLACNKTNTYVHEEKSFTKEDINRISHEVSVTIRLIREAKIKTGFSRKARTETEINDTGAPENCSSELASIYQINCFDGTFGDSFIALDPANNYSPVHHSFSVGLSNAIHSAFLENNNNLFNNSIMIESGLTSYTQDFLGDLEEEQKNYADLLQNDLSKSQTQIEQEMIQKINNQETFVLNSPSLSYNEKEYIITVLEIQKQYLDYYYSEISSIVTDNGNILMGIGLEQNKRRSFFGKLWRGLAFLAISLATSGKFTALAAKYAFKAAGKSALFTSSMKAAYFQIGIAIGWIPSWENMISKQKWNSNPWGDGSLYGWQKFALNIGFIFGVTV